MLTISVALGASIAGANPLLSLPQSNQMPTGAVLIIGTAAENETLQADTSGLADADGLGSLSYQWMRDGVAVAGATGTSYELGATDVGGVISVAVRYTDGRGTLEQVVSGATSPVAPPGETSVVVDSSGRLEIVSPADPVEIVVSAPAIYAGAYVAVRSDLAAGPVNLVPPRLEDTAEVGQPTRYTPGLWAYDATQGAAWAMGQWLRNGSAIADATAPEYVVQAADVDTALSVRETVTQVGLPMRTRFSDPLAIT